MKAKAIKAFTLDNEYYEENDDVEVKNVEQLVKLNEKGYIGPLTRKQIQEAKKEFETPKIVKRGEN